MTDKSNDIEKLKESFDMGFGLQCLEKHHVNTPLGHAVDAVMEWSHSNEGMEYWANVVKDINNSDGEIFQLPDEPREIIRDYVILCGGESRLPQDYELKYKAAIAERDTAVELAESMADEFNELSDQLQDYDDEKAAN